MKMLALLGAIGALSTVVLLQELKPQKTMISSVQYEFNEGFANFSSESLRLVSFGYTRVLSNLLWLRFLQYTPTQKVPENQVSWIYLDLEAISTIDPDFLPVFGHAAIFLSVITEDKKGAELLLLKGINLFPNNWRLRAFLAYHYQFELLNMKKAGEQYLAGSKLEGAPALLGILAARYLSKETSIDDSIQFLRGMEKSSTDEQVKKRFQLKIEEYEKKRHE